MILLTLEEIVSHATEGGQIPVRHLKEGCDDKRMCEADVREKISPELRQLIAGVEVQEGNLKKLGGNHHHKFQPNPPFQVRFQECGIVRRRPVFEKGRWARRGHGRERSQQEQGL